MPLNLNNPSGYDINQLRRMLEDGTITEAQLNAMPLNVSDTSPNSGGVSFAAPTEMAPNQLAPIMAPPPSALSQAVPGAGFQGLNSGQGVIQSTNPDGSQGSIIRIDSTPNDSRGTSAQSAPRDWSRGEVDTPNGRGYYGKDGRIYTPNGAVTSIVPEGTGARMTAAEDRRLKIAKMMADQAHTEAQTENVQAQTVLANMKPIGPTEKPIWDAERGVFITPPGAGGQPGVINVPGLGPKDKPLTESQGKAVTFGTRMANSNEILSAIGEGGNIQPGLLNRTVSDVPLIGGALGIGANKLPTWLGGASEAQKRVQQAQEDFLTADLRLESGATISEKEIERGNRQYFPQPNDPPALIEQKRRNREIAIAGFKEQAGTRGDRIDQTAAQSRGLLSAEKSGVAAPQQAIDYLKANPQMKNMFDMKYGAGAAAKVLGR